MPKKKGKKGPGPSVVDQRANDSEPFSTEHEDEQAVTDPKEPSEETVEGQGGGSQTQKKTNKKKNKKKDDWDEDFDMDEELKGLSLATEPDQGKGTNGQDKAGGQDTAGGKDEDDDKEGLGKESSDKDSKKGKAQKSGKKGRKAKKDDWEEMEMEAALAQTEEEAPTKPTSSSKKKAEEEGSSKEPEKIVQNSVNEAVSTVSVDAEADMEPVAEEEDDKKKKKKKKKGAGAEKEEKKAKKSTVGSAVKKRLEAVRAAQKLAEEEERRRIEAAEEAEHKRLEEIRIAEEKKMKKKMKEKEKIERLKKDGKYLSKSEKEKKAKQQAALELFKALGVNVPGLRNEGEGERKPVRYGNKVRSKKRPDQPQSLDSQLSSSSSIPEEQDRTGTGVEVESGECIVEDWEKEEERKPGGNGGEVLDCWDQDKEEDDDDKPEHEEEERGEKAEGGSETSSPLSVSPLEDGVVPSPRLGESGPAVGGQSQPPAESSSEGDSEGEEEEVLRSPVVCVLGHVDTGKTKILDKIRRTNVQDGEAGGITQQIGATFVPQYAIRDQTKHLKEFSRQELKVPGLLIIDTPGHESFSNLRTRGSSMCDLAILVVDIMHGLEPQTLESISILRRGRVPFVVALNKVDRLLEWRRSPTTGVRDSLRKQKPVAAAQFEELYQQTLVQFAEQELNVSLFWNKVDFSEYKAVCPTSAISGDGMGDLMALLVTVSQKQLLRQLRFSEDLECHVLEVKAISGLGMTVDVILRNGFLREGDTIVLCGSDGPFTTQIRSLLTPQPLRELRVKNAYVQHKTLAGAQGVKLTGKEMDKVLAGTPLYVASSPDEAEQMKDQLQATLTATLNAVKCQDVGVYVQASTLGSLEALVDFLKKSKIPYSGVNIGPVHKKDVMKASVMLEHKSDYAVILAFDVKIEREAQDMADNLGVKIFSADIIYHLFDNFTKHREELRQKLRDQYKDIAIFPCKFKILSNCIFKTRDPIVVGVKVEGGLIKVGTPLTVPSKNFCDIGIVTGMEVNHRPVELVRKGTEVCLKIEPTPGEAPRLLGRHFDENDTIVSKICRQSIDAVKEYFREDLQKSDWQLMVELKKQFHIL